MTNKSMFTQQTFNDWFDPNKHKHFSTINSIKIFVGFDLYHLFLKVVLPPFSLNPVKMLKEKSTLAHTNILVCPTLNRKSWCISTIGIHLSSCFWPPVECSVFTLLLALLWSPLDFQSEITKTVFTS